MDSILSGSNKFLQKVMFWRNQDQHVQKEPAEARTTMLQRPAILSQVSSRSQALSMSSPAKSKNGSSANTFMRWPLVQSALPKSQSSLELAFDFQTREDEIAKKVEKIFSTEGSLLESIPPQKKFEVSGCFKTEPETAIFVLNNKKYLDIIFNSKNLAFYLAAMPLSRDAAMSILQNPEYLEKIFALPSKKYPWSESAWCLDSLAHSSQAAAQYILDDEKCWETLKDSPAHLESIATAYPELAQTISAKEGSPGELVAVECKLINKYEFKFRLQLKPQEPKSVTEIFHSIHG